MKLTTKYVLATAAAGVSAAVAHEIKLIESPVLVGIDDFLKRDVPAYLQALPVPRSYVGLKELDLDAVWSLLPVVLFFAWPVILCQSLRKIRQAHDLEKNSEGLFQWNAFFYRHGDSFIAAVPFLLSYVPGILSMVAAKWAGAYSWLVFVAGYVLVPIADLFLGEDSYNPTQEEENKLKKNPWFVWLTLGYTPSYIATIFYAIYQIQEHGDELTNFQFAGITVGVGIAGGFGIGCVHELIHRPTLSELGSGIVALIFANYSHFWIEHLWGHHKRVATDEDPASSNIGDDWYTFLVKDMYKSFVSAVDIERRYTAKRNLGILSNRIVQGYACSLIITLTIYHYFGRTATIFYLLQGFITAVHIENANYIEHYGLRRRKVEGQFDKDGEPVYERPGWFHAWDTADRLTNWMLFKIQRHPDHHTNAGRPYQILRTLSFSPTLPTGYAGMIVLSWFPPLFWAVMDPLVENAYRQREKMEANGLAASAFPKGSNNMSSFFKREGEGYYEEGSSPYSTGEEWFGADKDKKSDVWEVDYSREFEKKSKSGKVVESGKIKAN